MIVKNIGIYKMLLYLSKNFGGGVICYFIWLNYLLLFNEKLCK